MDPLGDEKGYQSMDTATTISVLALLASIAAACASALLAWRTVIVSRQGNHAEVLLDLFKEHRSAEFMLKERRVWDQLPGMDPSLGFSNLSSPMREEVTEVALFYLEMAYFSEFKVADHDLIALQVQFRVQQTWAAIKRQVEGERVLRGGEYTFLNTLEIFVERARELDNEGIARRMAERR